MEIKRDLFCEINGEDILSRIMTKPRPRDVETVNQLLHKNKEILLPRVFCRKFSVQPDGDRTIQIGDFVLAGDLLKSQLALVDEVFVFVITLGFRFEKRLNETSNILERYYLEEMANAMLGQAQELFLESLKKDNQMDEIGTMQPGSLADWPIEGQSDLFDLLGRDTLKEHLGVSLNDSMMMSPRKTLSGIAYSSADGFISCRLCTQNHCPGRRAPYGKTLGSEHICEEQHIQCEK